MTIDPLFLPLGGSAIFFLFRCIDELDEDNVVSTDGVDGNGDINVENSGCGRGGSGRGGRGRDRDRERCTDESP